jgi:hypothetical protein
LGSAARESFMKNRIYGGIGVLLGGAILVSALISGGGAGQGAYGAGKTTGLFFGGLLFVVGLYYLVMGGGGSGKKE